MSVMEILLLVGIVVFVTHTIEAVTGFGCTVLAFPFVIFLMKDMEQAKIILAILALITAAYFVITKFRYINWKHFGIIVLFAGLGMPIGMLIYKYLDASILKKSLGAFIVITAAIQLHKSFVRKSNVRIIPKFVGYIFLFAGGIIHGAFAVGGPLVVLYSADKITDKGQFRVTMCLLWTILNTALLFQFLFGHKLTFDIGRDLIILLPFLIAGIIAGEVIHYKVNEALFRKVVFVSLFLVGIVLCF